MNKNDKIWLKSKINTLNDLIENLEYLKLNKIHSEIYWLKNLKQEIQEKIGVN